MEDNKIILQNVANLACTVKQIKKRSGDVVPFDATKIYSAIAGAVAVTSELTSDQVIAIVRKVLSKLDEKFGDNVPSVEEVQDIVVQTLMDEHAYKTAESYIVYRQRGTKIHPGKNVNV